MSDTLTVRDHSEDCAHGFRVGHMPGDGLEWCPGGREIRLRRWEEDSEIEVFYGPLWYMVEVDDDE